MSAEAIAASPRADWQRNLAVLWCGQFFVTAGLTVVVPLMPFYLEELGATSPASNRAWTGWAIAAPAFTLMIAAPLWGRLGDRLGRKWMVVRALFGIALAVIGMGLAATPVELFVCRLLQGAFGGVDDAAAAFAQAQVPAAQQGRALGLLQTATAGGALVGPLAGGFLSATHGFAPIILVVGGLIALAALVAAYSLDEEQRRAPTGGRAAMGAGLLALVRDPGTRAFLLAGLLIQIGGYGIIGVFAVHVRALAPDGAAAVRWVGALQALTWSMTLAGAAYWGRRNDHHAAATSFIAASLLTAASVALQAFTRQLAWLAPLRAVQGFGSSGLGQTVYLHVGRAAPPDQRGLRIGVANSFLTAGQVAGALLAAALGGLVGAPAVLLAMSSSFVIAAALVAAHARPIRGEKTA